MALVPFPVDITEVWVKTRWSVLPGFILPCRSVALTFMVSSFEGQIVKRDKHVRWLASFSGLVW